MWFKTDWLLIKSRKKYSWISPQIHGSFDLTWSNFLRNELVFHCEPLSPASRHSYSPKKSNQGEFLDWYNDASKSIVSWGFVRFIVQLTFSHMLWSELAFSLASPPKQHFYQFETCDCLKRNLFQSTRSSFVSVVLMSKNSFTGTNRASHFLED